MASTDADFAHVTADRSIAGNARPCQMRGWNSNALQKRRSMSRLFLRVLFIGVISLSLVGADSGSASAVLAAETVQLLPPSVTLSGPTARQRLLVQQHDGVRFTRQLADAELVSSNEQIVRVQGQTLIPIGNGTATITVQSGPAQSGKPSSSMTVTVQGFEAPRVWSFRNDVQPVLAKAGCNSGACHGALAGKGGFKLSLRGYDSVNDYHTIARQARGRRVELSDPGTSLLLIKPTGAVPHKGGLRFETDSPEYHVLAEWIAQGAPGPLAEEPHVTSVEVWPPIAALQLGESEQVVVLAKLSDGTTRDVTSWAKFTSTNETVCQVSEQGSVTLTGAGEGAITAWYNSQIGVARVTVPYSNDVPAERYAQEPRRNFIDELVLAKLQDLRLPPAELASDTEFLRRAYLDTIGTLPKPDEIRAFLADDSADKRDQVIEQLLSRPEFIDYWTYKWSDLLLINGQKLRPAAVKSYYEWVHKQVAANTPWDQFVTQIVTAQGSSVENGATNFYALHQDPETMAENVSQAFLGLSIGCAKCHNHPLEKWTNNQYYAFANLFSRVRAKGWGGDFRSGDGIRTLYVETKGELIQPLTGKPQPPTPLDGTPLSFEDAADRRVELAKWLTSPENPYFSRTITNRVWANFFGVGLVEAVDDLRVSNPASNPELLDAAARYLVENRYDLKSLMRVILQSRAYQRSSVTVPGNAADQRYYSHYFPKRLMAEVLLDAIVQATDVPTEFNEIGFPGGDKQKIEIYPKGTRAIQLHDSAVASYFLKAFGRNAREITCECERSDEPSMVQVLHIANGDTLNQKLRVAGNRIDQLLMANLPDEQLIEEIYLWSLSRIPTAGEKSGVIAVFKESAGTAQRELLEDLFWSLLSSREFLFNH